MFDSYIVGLIFSIPFVGVSALPLAIHEEPYEVPTVVHSVVQEGEGTASANYEKRILNAIRTQYPAPLKTTEDDGPDVDAAAAIIMDVSTERILWQKNPDNQLPIASITKLMTALTWLDHMPVAGMDHVHTFAPEQDTVYGKELNLGHGEQLAAFDLLRSSIVGSDNDTALGLVATTEAGEEQFVQWMNEKAVSIGMNNSHFDDATGLSSDNTATVGDIARLALYAFRQEEIQAPASMTVHEQRTVESNRLTRVATTNQLLYDPEVEIIGGKTGFITEAGYCLVVQARVYGGGDTDEGGYAVPRDIIAVVLGTDAQQARFDEVKKLILWSQAHYTWEIE